MAKQSPIKKARNLPELTKLMLFVQAGGRCEFDGHNRYLLQHPLTLKRINLAEAAHIVAFRDAGPRGDFEPRPENINQLDNLMLLCPDCHKLVDSHPEQYSVATLREYKRKHEERIFHLTGLGPDLRTTIVQFKANIGDQRVDIPAAEVLEAVAPRYPNSIPGYVIDLTRTEGQGDSFYDVARQTIDRRLAELYSPCMDVGQTKHISLFALGPIPLLMHLGSRLSNKISTDFFQRHRDSRNWRWKSDGQPVEYEHRLVRAGTDPKKVALLLSLSGRISPEQLPGEIDHTFFVYEIALRGGRTGTDFLQLKEDLTNFEVQYRASLTSILSEHGQLDSIHLFPAIPAPIAVVCGYDLLPKVYPAIVVYDYDKSAHGFSRTIRINEP